VKIQQETAWPKAPNAAPTGFDAWRLPALPPPPLPSAQDMHDRFMAEFQQVLRSEARELWKEFFAELRGACSTLSSPDPHEQQVSFTLARNDVGNTTTTPSSSPSRKASGDGMLVETSADLPHMLRIPTTIITCYDDKDLCDRSPLRSPAKSPCRSPARSSSKNSAKSPSFQIGSKSPSQHRARRPSTTSAGTVESKTSLHSEMTLRSGAVGVSRQSIMNTTAVERRATFLGRDLMSVDDMFASQNAVDAVVCVVLLLEAIFVGVVADYRADAETASDQLPWQMVMLQSFFCVFFTLEIAVRVYAHGGWPKSGKQSAWFALDTSLVVLSLVDLFLPLVAGKETQLGTFGVIRMLRVLRFLRILRLLRVVRFVAELRKVVYLIIGSLLSFFWTATLLALLIYMLAIFFTEMVSDGLRNAGQPSTDSVLFTHFGSTSRSVYTLYKSVSGGVDWQEVSDPLMDQISPWLGVVFSFYSAFAVLVLLNLVTGMFVEAAHKLSKSDKETELLVKVQRAFESLGLENTQSITLQEFQAHLESGPMVDFFETLEISTARAQDLFLLIDHAETGKLSFEQLVAGGVMLQGPAKAVDLCAITTMIEEYLSDIQLQLNSLRQDLV